MALALTKVQILLSDMHHISSYDASDFTRISFIVFTYHLETYLGYSNE